MSVETVREHYRRVRYPETTSASWTVEGRPVFVGVDFGKEEKEEKKVVTNWKKEMENE